MNSENPADKYSREEIVDEIRDVYIKINGCELPEGNVNLKKLLNSDYTDFIDFIDEVCLNLRVPAPNTAETETISKLVKYLEDNASRKALEDDLNEQIESFYDDVGL